MDLLSEKTNHREKNLDVQRCLDLLQVYIRNIPPTITCNANSVREFSETVLLFSVSDYAETGRGKRLIV